jgi:NAD(P)-dependent dehydrogenase (short-subunit alcohol dehydrogenase family)
VPKLFSGKTALVTGSSRGIGRSIAQRLAAEGATVVVTGRSLDTPVRDPGTLRETVALIEEAGGRAIPIACDLNQQDQVERLVAQATEAAGPIDILINNAGIADYHPFDRMPLEVFDRTVSNYLRVPFILIKAVLPQMRERGQGWVVNIGSATAQAPQKPYSVFDTDMGATIYGTMKAAVNRFTQGTAAELLKYNIAVNMVAPSTAIITPGARQYIPEDYPGENVAYLVQCVVELCQRSAVERTGVLAHSMHYPAKHGIAVMDLDGVTPLPPAEIPAWSHPNITE